MWFRVVVEKNREAPWLLRLIPLAIKKKNKQQKPKPKQPKQQKTQAKTKWTQNKLKKPQQTTSELNNFTRSKEWPNMTKMPFSTPSEKTVSLLAGRIWDKITKHWSCYGDVPALGSDAGNAHWSRWIAHEMTFPSNHSCVPLGGKNFCYVCVLALRAGHSGCIFG